jgi:glutathione S-transferase
LEKTDPLTIMSHPKITLIYFNGTGRAQATRLTFAVGGVPFEDKRLDGPSYYALSQNKEECPLGTLPLLLIDGKLVGTQSHAIRRHAGRLAKLTIENPEDAFRADEIEFTADDLLGIYYKAVFAPDEATKATNTKELLTSGFQHYASYIDRVLGQGKGPFASSHISSSDIFVYCVVSYVLQLGADSGVATREELLKPFPHLQKLVEAAEAIPAIRDYKA